MTPIKQLPPGYVAPPITPKPRPTVNFGLPQGRLPQGQRLTSNPKRPPFLKSFGLKKGGTTKLHSITKSSKKSNW